VPLAPPPGRELGLCRSAHHRPATRRDDGRGGGGCGCGAEPRPQALHEAEQGGEGPGRAGCGRRGDLPWRAQPGHPGEIPCYILPSRRLPAASIFVFFAFFPSFSADLCGGYVLVLFAILMQFKVRKCDVCWQELPPGYLVPADEPWSTGIFGCAEDPKSCTSYYTGHFYCCLPSRRFYFSHHRLYVLRMDRIRALLQEMLLFSFLRCSLMHAFPNSHACSCCGNYMDLQSCVELFVASQV
jgi:hypothetical protein